MAYWRASSYLYVVSHSSTVAPLTCRKRFPDSITEPEPAHSPGIKGYESRQQRSDCAVATAGIENHRTSMAMIFIDNLPRSAAQLPRTAEHHNTAELIHAFRDLIRVSLVWGAIDRN